MPIVSAPWASCIIPDFSTPAPRVILDVPLPPDLIHAAIKAHRTAYDAFQVAPDGDASLEAEEAYDEAGAALVATACTTRRGAVALLSHLRWWLSEEAEYAEAHQPAYGIAQARAADLALLMESGR